MLSPIIDIVLIVAGGLACTFSTSAVWRATWWGISVANAVYLVVDLRAWWLS